MSEDYSVGYAEGFDTGRNEAIDEFNAEIAALAEQNEKMREALQECQGRLSIRWEEEVRIECLIVEALSLPNLSTLVLNKYRAEGMRMASQFCIDNPLSDAHCLAEMLRDEADELEKTK